jgi:hypothetical protein
MDSVQNCDSYICILCVTAVLEERISKFLEVFSCCMLLAVDEQMPSKPVVSLIKLQLCCSLNSKFLSCPLSASVSIISELLTHYVPNPKSYNHLKVGKKRTLHHHYWKPLANIMEISSPVGSSARSWGTTFSHAFIAIIVDYEVLLTQLIIMKPKLQ